VPLTSGWLSLDGEAGVVAEIVGAPGASESSVYEIEFEQPDGPFGLVALALSGVTELLPTVIVIPAPVKSARLPVVGVPVQLLLG
jgi:hypothetical protein